MTRKKTSADKGLDFGILPSLAGYQLRLAQIAIFRDFAAALGEFDVTPGLFGVIVIIDANPGLKQSELARAAHLDRSTVVSVIDNLERRRLVERRPAENDRRSNALVLTPDGIALLKKLKRRVGEHEKRLVEHLSEEERVTLVTLLQKIFPEQR
ncbi:MarR family winged helix-turn-helix transcriptional regulator [Aromatoleum aromaticum]|uniref:Bacterial regulatory protein, MarR n=1 Tax=Aromatoleum aromaticum (strain DSM 19018 / LMG 30748 / EbN1) TaxID=76114 RepID=Q5P0I4_AROAE|nr:MarR family transcriptional regulator [Aromatoleum aromaticum]NMG53843.1 MarR family transcriptional regulator [Aromatoleum aromaticum]CAI09180.1 Bacterial regulatory protein, MarR [Aromatoleum aromaticum EbN1]